MMISPRTVGVTVALLVACLLAGPVVVIRNRSDDNRRQNAKTCHLATVERSLLRTAVVNSRAVAVEQHNGPLVAAYDRDLTKIDRTPRC